MRDGRSYAGAHRTLQGWYITQWNTYKSTHPFVFLAHPKRLDALGLHLELGEGLLAGSARLLLDLQHVETHGLRQRPAQILPTQDGNRLLRMCLALHLCTWEGPQMLTSMLTFTNRQESKNCRPATRTELHNTTPPHHRTTAAIGDQKQIDTNPRLEQRQHNCNIPLLGNRTESKSTEPG